MSVTVLFPCCCWFARPGADSHCMMRNASRQQRPHNHGRLVLPRPRLLTCVPACLPGLCSWPVLAARHTPATPCRAPWVGRSRQPTCRHVRQHTQIYVVLYTATGASRTLFVSCSFLTIGSSNMKALLLQDHTSNGQPHTNRTGHRPRTPTVPRGRGCPGCGDAPLGWWACGLC